MEGIEHVPRGLFSLPNEILLRIIDHFDLPSVLSLTPTCRHFHCLAMRIVHNRLQVASTLEGHEFYVECHPPSARLTASKMFCKTLGAESLDNLASAIYDGNKHVGQVKKAFGTYSRFRPQYHEPALGRIQWKVPGDIPGSRTHPSSNPVAAIPSPDDPVVQTVSIDAHDLFSQLSTRAFLAQRGSHGLLTSIHDVSQGNIRVWRQWLAFQCEQKQWSDGEPVVVHHEPPSSPIGKGRADSVVGAIDPRHDKSVLWFSTQDENVGIKFRVKERKSRQHNAVLFSSEEELPVSYLVEFVEIVVRTTHLVQKLEEAKDQVLNQTGKAVIFASVRG